MAHPAAYLRRSYVDLDSPGDISLEAQRTAVRRLATADAHNGNVVEYNDWGVSADIAKAQRRTEYNRLLADMEAGRVAAVYAFDVDRLYRDPRDLIRLQDAAQRFHVRIVTTAGPLAIGDGDDPAAEGFAFMGAVFGRMELQKIKKRNRAAREARMKRGDRFGHPAYGYKHVRQEGPGPDQSRPIIRVPDPDVDLEPIRSAYLEARTVLGASKLLNRRNVPSPKGGKWYTSALTRVITEHWPELLPPKGASGKRIPPAWHKESRKSPPASVLAQLVRCHCGHTMTPNTKRSQFYCSHGTNTAPDHGRYVAQEAPLIEWAKAEAARLQIPADRVELSASVEGKRQALQERRQRVIDNYEDGLITREQRDAKIAGVQAELDRLGSAEAVAHIPDIDWSWPPEKLNAVLRALWDYIEVNEAMLPVSAAWKVPEWRG